MNNEFLFKNYKDGAFAFNVRDTLTKQIMYFIGNLNAVTLFISLMTFFQKM